MGCLRKQILKVALKNFANADFIAMNLRSNGKSMCFPSGSQFNGPHNALHTHTHTHSHTQMMLYIPIYRSEPVWKPVDVLLGTRYAQNGWKLPGDKEIGGARCGDCRK